MLNTIQASWVSCSAIGELLQQHCILCTLNLLTALPRNPSSSNFTEEAGDAFCSFGCQVTISIKCLCFSCSFNCSTRNENKVLSSLKSVRSTTTKTRQRFHSMADISLWLPTVLQRQQESQLTPLVLQQIPGSLDLRCWLTFKHPIQLQLVSRQKIALTPETAKVSPRCSPREAFHLCTTLNTFFSKSIASVSLSTLFSSSLSQSLCEARSRSHYQVKAWLTCLNGNSEKPLLSHVRTTKK